jgi:predicted HAD superfamily hydrolase
MNIKQIDDLIDTLKEQKEYIEALKDLCADWVLLNDKMIEDFGFDATPQEDDDRYDTVDELGSPQT